MIPNYDTHCDEDKDCPTTDPDCDTKHGVCCGSPPRKSSHSLLTRVKQIGPSVEYLQPVNVLT